MSDLGKRIRQRRIELGISQAELSKATGCNQQNLSRIERGETTRTSYAPHIAAALDTNVDWLLYGDERKRPPVYPNHRAAEAPVLDPAEAASYETYLARWGETRDLDAIPIPMTKTGNLSSLVFWVEVMDDAMEPALPERSLCLVDALTAARPKSLVVARRRSADPGDAVVRRYRATQDGFELVPDSEWYSVLGSDDWAIIGRVVMVAHEAK